MHNQKEATLTPLLVSVDAAAHLLGISPKTIRNRSSTGSFPLPIVKLGGRSLLRLADIHAFVCGGDAPPTSAPVNKKRGRGRPRKELISGGAK